MSQARTSSFRADIQGLRALAVGLVFVYHLWPAGLSGGYVGVDVFFVISGFLITSHLLAHPPRGGRDLVEFWSRRIRRLLPAAFVVLAVTAIAARAVAPASQWRSIATEIIASALYVQNWALASSSVDYLAADDAPTPTQHFWSLSVEEQFYLLWPILLLLVFLVARRARVAPSPIVRVALAAVVVGSLAISMTATAGDPASAYFVTPTRVWELAAGGLLAALGPLGELLPARAAGVLSSRASRRVASAAAWIGLVLIVVAGMRYSGATAFPGAAALLPVGGAALVIAAAATSRWSPAPLLALPPVQFLGDISYSVYLWHWPLIALAPYVTGSVGLLDAAAIVVATLVLASLTKVLVEDRFRFAGWLQRPIPTFRFAAAGMAVLVAVGSLQITEVQVRASAASQRLASVEESAPSCFGAASIVTGFDRCPQDPAATLVPDPALAKDDRSDAYRDNCWSEGAFAEHPVCRYGHGPIQVALVGNSHAGHWLPALQVLAQERGWTLTTFLASRCGATDSPLAFDTAAKTQGCLDWGRWVLEQTRGTRFDLVITSERQSAPVQGLSFARSQAPATAGYLSYLRRWTAGGTRLVILRDTPAPGNTTGSIPDCLAKHAADQTACADTPAAWRWMDPLADAARQLAAPNVTVIDPTGWFCTATTCPAAIGSVVVYFDGSHMTATYSRTLAPYLDGLIPSVAAD